MSVLLALPLLASCSNTNSVVNPVAAIQNPGAFQDFVSNDIVYTSFNAVVCSDASCEDVSSSETVAWSSDQVQANIYAHVDDPLRLMLAAGPEATLDVVGTDGAGKVYMSVLDDSPLDLSRSGEPNTYDAHLQLSLYVYGTYNDGRERCPVELGVEQFGTVTDNERTVFAGYVPLSAAEDVPCLQNLIDMATDENPEFGATTHIGIELQTYGMAEYVIGLDDQ